MKIENLNPKLLHLNLKKKWFDMIATGEKKEEYRDIKDYYYSRMVDYISNHSHLYNQPHLLKASDFRSKQYDWIVFKNGYQKDAPTIYVELLGIEIKKGKKEWGAEEGKYYFTLKLGKIIDPKIK